MTLLEIFEIVKTVAVALAVIITLTFGLARLCSGDCMGEKVHLPWLKKERREARRREKEEARERARWICGM